MSLRKIFAAAALAAAGMAVALGTVSTPVAAAPCQPMVSVRALDSQMESQGLQRYAGGVVENKGVRSAFLLYRTEPARDAQKQEQPAGSWVMLRVGDAPAVPGAQPVLRVCEAVKGSDLTRVFDRYPLGVLAAAPAQQATPPAPSKREEIVKMLAEKYNEHRVAYGISADGRTLIEIFDVPDNDSAVRKGDKTDSFTIIVTDAATGRTQMLGAGSTWTFFDKKGAPIPNTGMRPPAV